MNGQVKLVATGWIPSIPDYLASEQWQVDRPGFVIDRGGTIHGGHGERDVIALVNAGELERREGQWIPVRRPADYSAGGFVPYEYCSCGKAFEMMPTRQLNALRRLLKSLLSQLHIQYPYDNQLGKVCPRAIAGRPGVFFASSYDKYRTDIHPQIELLHIIQSLAS